MSRVYADPAVRDMISAANVGKSLTPEHRARISASSRMKDPEVRARVSAATKAAMSDPELKERMTHAHREAMLRPEVKRKIALSNKNSGKSLPDAVKARISAALKERPRRTVCRLGHALTPRRDDPSRQTCRECRAERQRERRASRV